MQNSRPVQAQKKVAAFTSALARDRNAQAHSTRADQGSHNKAVMAPTQEKYSGLRVRISACDCSNIHHTKITISPSVFRGLRIPSKLNCSAAGCSKCCDDRQLALACSISILQNVELGVFIQVTLVHPCLQYYLLSAVAQDCACALTIDSDIADEESRVPQRCSAGAHVHAALPTTLTGRVRIFH